MSAQNSRNQAAHDARSSGYVKTGRLCDGRGGERRDTGAHRAGRYRSEKTASDRLEDRRRSRCFCRRRYGLFSVRARLASRKTSGQPGIAVAVTAGHWKEEERTRESDGEG